MASFSPSPLLTMVVMSLNIIPGFGKSGMVVTKSFRSLMPYRITLSYFIPCQVRDITYLR